MANQNSTYYSFLTPKPGGAPLPVIRPSYTPSAGGTTPPRFYGVVHYPGSSGYAPAGRTIDIFPDQGGWLSTTGQAPPPGTPGAPPPAKPGDEISLITKVKDPEQEARVKALGADYEAMKKSGEGSLADFTSAWSKSLTGARSRLGQETGALSRYYTGEVGGDLASLRALEDQKFEDLNNRLIAAAARAQSSKDIARGGLGASSYNTRVATGVVGDIDAREAVRQIAQRRADEDYVRAAQERLAGRRTGLESDVNRMILTPAQAQAEWYDRVARSAGMLGDIGRENRAYGYTKPYDPMTETFFPGFNYSAGGPMGGGGGPRGNYRLPPPNRVSPAGGGKLYLDPQTGRPLTSDEANRRFPGGGYRDQYGRWMEPDANGVWRVVPGQPGYSPTFGPSIEDQFYMGNNIGPEEAFYLGNNVDPETGFYWGDNVSPVNPTEVIGGYNIYDTGIGENPPVYEGGYI